MMYTSRPHEVRAWQIPDLTGEELAAAIPEWVQNRVKSGFINPPKHNNPKWAAYSLLGLHMSIVAFPGDYIVYGPAHQWTFIPEKVFKEKYEIKA